MSELKCKIPDIYSLDISLFFDETCSENQFLLDCTPHSLDYLSIEDSLRTSSVMHDCYCSGIIEAVKGVTQQVYLKNLVVSGATFEGIVKGASQAKELVFNFCQIDSNDELDLSGPDYK